MNQLNEQLKIYPVWTNAFYLLFSVISIIFLFIYKLYKFHFRNIVWLLVISMFVEGIISILHHVSDTAYIENQNISKYGKAMLILDEIGASFVGLLCLFIIINNTHSSNNQYHYLFNIIFICLIIFVAICGAICYGLDIYYENKKDIGKENYEIYDIFHSQWHTMTAIAFLLTFLFIIFNYKIFKASTPAQYPRIEKYILSLLIILIIVILSINLH